MLVVEDMILREITTIMMPILQMYGIYIIAHGAASPGGGFAGGSVLGLSMMLYALVLGKDRSLEKVPPKATSILVSLGPLWYASLGFVGIIWGTKFLMNKGAGVPLGTPGSLFSSGLIAIITVGVGLKVASTMLSLFHILTEEAE